MTDVTIPAADAKRLADYLRAVASDAENERLADLLDPPKPSLRYDVTVALCEVADWDDADSFATQMTDAALAVVRRHVEALLSWPSSGGDVVISRADVLRMLDGES